MQRQLIKNEMVILFDIDETLVVSGCDLEKHKAIPVEDPYSRKIVYRLPHEPHIRLLRNYLVRGAIAIVWSKNGNQWANAVLDALKIDHKNILVLTKPFAYVDDQTSDRWMGEHVNMPVDHIFGREK